MECPNCGSSLKSNSTRCVKCGSTIDFSGIAQQSSTVPQPQVVYVQQPSPQNLMRCPKCATGYGSSQVYIKKGKLTGKEWLLGLILCLCYLWPGILYFAIKANQMNWICPNCGKKVILRNK